VGPGPGKGAGPDPEDDRPAADPGPRVLAAVRRRPAAVRPRCRAGHEALGRTLLDRGRGAPAPDGPRPESPPLPGPGGHSSGGHRGREVGGGFRVRVAGYRRDRGGCSVRAKKMATFRIAAGTKCQIKHRNTASWVPFTTRRDLEFTEHTSIRHG